MPAPWRPTTTSAASILECERFSRLSQDDRWGRGGGIEGAKKSLSASEGGRPQHLPLPRRPGAPNAQGVTTLERIWILHKPILANLQQQTYRAIVVCTVTGFFKAPNARTRMDTQVLIVGAGPVGLTLAIDLGDRGVQADREKCGTARLSEDGALQPSHHGDFPTHRDRRAGPRRGLSRRLADGCVFHFQPDAPASVAEAKAERDRTNDGSTPLEPYQAALRA